MTVDPAQADRRALQRAIEEAGYSVPDGNGRTAIPASAAAAGAVVGDGAPSRAASPPLLRRPRPRQRSGTSQLAACTAPVAWAALRTRWRPFPVSRMHASTSPPSVPRWWCSRTRSNLDRLVESVGKAGYSARRSEMSFGAEAASGHSPRA